MRTVAIFSKKPYYLPQVIVTRAGRSLPAVPWVVTHCICVMAAKLAIIRTIRLQRDILICVVLKCLQLVRKWDRLRLFAGVAKFGTLRTQSQPVTTIFVKISEPPIVSAAGIGAAAAIQKPITMLTVDASAALQNLSVRFFAVIQPCARSNASCR